MTTTTNRLAFVAIAATFSVMPLQTQAQDAFAALDVSMPPAAAEEMESLAYDMILAGRGWEQAAGLYLRAAAMRGAADPRSATDVRLAGYIYFYKGRPQAAVTSLTGAGEAYLALGDVEGAAETFIDAAWVAAKVGMTAEARGLADRARLLTRSPLLEPSARFGLAERLGATPGTE
ncbi:MAG: hypothetical protein ABL963_07780 [Longimicrobiales bacterium]